MGVFACNTIISIFGGSSHFIQLAHVVYTLYVQERDEAGNWSPSGSFAITIDVTSPAAPIVTGITPTDDTTPTWTWTSGGGGGNGTYRYKLDDSDLSTGATETTLASFTPASPLAGDTYILYVQERDDAGNWSTSGSFTIAINFAITATAGANGTVTPSGTVTVNQGANQTFTITPDTGYHVADVLVDGVSVGATTTYTFTSVTVDHTISASFAINTYTLTVAISGTGSGAVTSSTTGIDCGVDCSEVYNHGTAVTLTTTATSGSTFAGWSGVCTGTGSCIVMMDGAKSATAIFNVVTVSTLAGSGTAGYTDGTGTAAQFNFPSGVAVDSSGNVYVADTSNHRIRKITSAGVVSTMAGSGTAGYTDGTGAAAQFNTPFGVAIDSLGNVYVADRDSQRIRKITSAGVVSTMAGSGTAGYTDGTGTAAQFNFPNGVAVDSLGNVYVADFFNHRIRKISPPGVVSTLAGNEFAGYADGTGAAAQFNFPIGVAVDSSGNVYVADRDNNRIRKITPTGVVSTLAGTGAYGFANGPGLSAQFRYPSGVAVDSSGNVYVADIDNNQIRRIMPTGVVSTLAGSGTAGFSNGTETAAQFDQPFGVAIDSLGNVYVADFANNRIRKITQ